MEAAWSTIWPQAIALIVALLAAWVVYRLQRREEREGVLSALIAELQLHEEWVGHKGYPKDMWGAGYSAKWWGGKQPGQVDNVVYKLSTVATDSAIQVGPSLFSNRALVRTLVNYRQRAQQLNQMIDDMAAFRATADLWVPPHDKQSQARWDLLSDRLNGLAGLVHEGGIGDLTSDGANRHYLALRSALRAERTATWWRRWLWFWLGISRRAKGEPEPSW
jgi:hypothetical protein